MSVTKSINTNYTISTQSNALANVTVLTNTLYVSGNMVVGGTSTSITKKDLEITDNTITLNKGGGGAGGVVLITSGIEIDRKDSAGVGPANVSILWNESYDKWTLTSDGSTFANILSTTGGGTILTELVDDLSPQLGGNLDTLNRAIFSSNVAYVRFSKNVAVNYTSVAPTAVANRTLIYAQTPDLGTSGLYVTTTNYSEQELITKSKAVWYSLIM
jgi:hypothetical protein